MFDNRMYFTLYLHRTYETKMCHFARILLWISSDFLSISLYQSVCSQQIALTEACQYSLLGTESSALSNMSTFSSIILNVVLFFCLPTNLSVCMSVLSKRKHDSRQDMLKVTTQHTILGFSQCQQVHHRAGLNRGVRGVWEA